MSRWKHKTETVTVDENTQEVRGMTAGERKQFAEASKEIKDGKRSPATLPYLIAGFCAVNPAVTPEDIEAMPSDLLDAIVSKAMLLSGFKDKQKKDLEPPTELPPFPELNS